VKVVEMNALYWSDIVDGKHRGPAAACVRAALLPASLAYRLAVSARRAAYDRGILRSRVLPRPVVSVGNLVVGGTGKTPLVKLLARGLRERGLRAAVLSRGYGAEGGGQPFPRLVSDGSRVLLCSREAGDEARMLADSLEGTIVAVDPDRARAGEMVASRFPVDAFILDDGFQHRRLARDADILLLDAARPFGNGRVLPAGRLREPASAMRRAGAIVLTRCPRPPDPAMLAVVRSLNPRAELFTSTHEPARLVEIPSGTVREPRALAGKTVAAFCGIAVPGDFARTLAGLGARVALLRPYPDHHPYTAPEIEQFAAAAAEAGAEAVVTTSKDAVRLPGDLRCPLPLHALEIEMKIGGGDGQLLQWVFESIGARATTAR
jgi:tetraacyldisaccharide 4'-kinase